MLVYFALPFVERCIGKPLARTATE